MKRSPGKINRRRFIADSTVIAAGSVAAAKLGATFSARAAEKGDSKARQACGVKVGEVTDSSAIVWMRLTANTTSNAEGPAVTGKVKKDGKKALPGPVSGLKAACPGAAGQVRVRYGTREDLSDAKATDWTAVSEQTDFVHQFAVSGLKAGTV